MTHLRCDIGDAVFRPLPDLERIELPVGATFRADLASGGQWFGHGFAHRQPWPLQAEPVVNDRFAVNNCQSPIWMCSAGVAILAETTEELAVAIAEGQLRVRCDNSPITLRLFRGPDLPAAHRKLLAHLGWPNPGSQSATLGDSIFCTWTQYPRCITQKRVLDMAERIRAHGWPCSTIVIDDRWESAFGELEFGRRDFPDPPAMVRRLHELGFRVLLWVTPFVNREAATFDELARSGALVRRRDGAGAAMLKWWGGSAGLIDLTGQAGPAWLRSRLEWLRDEVGVDGFKIDGGDAKYQPPPAESAWACEVGPSGYSDRLLELFEQVAPGACETRTMWLSQRRAILWRQGGKDSHWGVDNGLAAMAHLGLHMALLGYDIQIPDMIPGRVQTMSSDDPLPTDELMVRWTEASAAFPIMQFSYWPWNYAAATADACLGWARAHKAMESYLHAHAAGRAAPLLRPAWYDDPARAELYARGDQWMLGPDLLAAPVLSPGVTRRDVILPAGTWRDAWTGERRSAGLLRDLPAPCPGMPLFVRDSNDALLSALGEALSHIRRGSVEPGATTATHQAGLNRDLSVTG
ncbi:MAG: hypothetical protein BIFFINMI_01834 [Phycisphaerae bacterium]|nr:hypothetical protein [Phycisphaerae bacterium]